MSSPERCLTAAPGSGDSDEGEHHSFRDFQHFVSDGLRRIFVVAQVMSDFNVGTSSFGHWAMP
jgi:hypothetical protein